jgi:hypothetical protein
VEITNNPSKTKTSDFVRDQIDKFNSSVHSGGGSPTKTAKSRLTESVRSPSRLAESSCRESSEDEELISRLFYKNPNIDIPFTEVSLTERLSEDVEFEKYCCLVRVYKSTVASFCNCRRPSEQK